MKKYTVTELAQFIDLTNLKPFATDQDIKNMLIVILMQKSDIYY